MNKKLKCLLGAISMTIASAYCQVDFTSLVQEKSAVEVNHDEMKIRIEVVDDGIIRVKKSPINASGYSTPNLVAVLEPQDIEWKLKKSKSNITIKTDELSVILNSDGTIVYNTKRGKHLVSETNERTHLRPESTQSAASQSFTVGEEALYGLGQFQSGIFDWKNVPMTLRQDNQEAAVPFLVSTKNYGILWNTGSVTDFNPAEHEILLDEKRAEVASLDYDATNIDVENVVTSKSKVDNSSNIRETTFTPDQTGLYTFFVVSDTGRRMKGHVKVTFDDAVVVDYSTIWIPRCFSGRTYLEAGREYKVVFQNSGGRIPGRLFYNTPDYNKTVFSSQSATDIDYYLIAGESPAEVIELNHKLTGQAPLMNKKSYGFWQCRERYHTQEELLANANEMRDRKIPFDVIVQDWFYWPQGTKGPEWDREKYPDPAAMVKEVHDLNLDIMVSVWPTISNDPLLAKYDMVEGKKLGKTHYFDFWDKDIAKTYYKILSDSMFHFGVNSIWLDGSEPEAKPNRDYLTGMGEFRYVANSYSLMVTKAMYEGKREEFPSERVMNLTRSAFIGQQRYSAVTWSGDVQATWKQFREQIIAGLNFTMSGVSYWSHDIGGFFRDSKSLNPIFDSQYTNPEYIELLSRWFQFGMFSPVFRIHGYVSETEIWRYGTEFETLARKFIDLRYQLLPYIYSEAWKVTQKGHLMMSPLAYYYPNDKNTWTIKDQLFFGENIMAAFATEYKQRDMDVYLPEGVWYDFWTNKMYKGKQTINVAVPLDHVPMFVKAGSIIPFGPKLQYATQPTTEPTRIRIYPGADAEYTMYFDDNESYDYENGEYSELKFSFDEKRGYLEVEAGEDSYIDFKENPMDFIINVMGFNKIYKITFDGEEIELNLGID